MDSSLFVGNLPKDMNNKNLHSLFSKYGEVISAKVVYDRNTGVSKGFGFVRMNPNYTENALQHLNGSNSLGTKLVVKYAESRN
jgi:RNA recognition motif-containing protein